MDITITGGVLGVTERRRGTPDHLDQDTRDALETAFLRGSTDPVPSSGGPVRDGRVVTITMRDATISFDEHRAPPFWRALRPLTRPRGG